jgi:hypothetical protein
MGCYGSAGPWDQPKNSWASTSSFYLGGVGCAADLNMGKKKKKKKKRSAPNSTRGLFLS